MLVETDVSVAGNGIHGQVRQRHRPNAYRTTTEGDLMLDTDTPVRSLRQRLEEERLVAIDALAKHPEDRLPADLLRHVAELHLALSAVVDEIDRHAVKVGYGGEEPLT
jgi:hypothetical protein